MVVVGSASQIILVGSASQIVVVISASQIILVGSASQIILVGSASQIVVVRSASQRVGNHALICTKDGGCINPPQQPFLLSKGLAPVPPKLVTKIQNLEFVDMAELLRDNLEVQRQVASQDQSAST